MFTALTELFLGTVWALSCHHFTEEHCNCSDPAQAPKGNIALRLEFVYWRQMGELLKIIRGQLVKPYFLNSLVGVRECFLKEYLLHNLCR